LKYVVKMKIQFGEKILECDAIAFDKDGTLIDSHSFWWGLYEARAAIVLSREGKEVLDQWTQVIGVDPQRNFIDPSGIHALGSLQEEEIVLTSCISSMHQIPQEEALIRSKTIMNDADKKLPLEAYTKTLPGVPDTLFRLHEFGLPMAVLTQDRIERVVETLHFLGLQSVIKIVVTPSEVKCSKPAPDMLILAAKQLSMTPKKMVMVGDSVVDMEMAHSAGAIPVFLSRDKTYPESFGDIVEAVVRTISEIRIDQFKSAPSHNLPR
jgi:HAD superfamily hydrolase (TIGR01549 family)